ncbi:AI-2E family transporter [Alcaligenaceae bacterium]|nr:AI-2E family transporter [Alcaligenaceae bacterium]
MPPIRIRISTIMAALLAGAGLILAYQLASTLLLVFAGVLLAVVLDVAALGLKRILPIHRLARLAIVTTIACLLLIAAIVWGGMRLLNEAKNLIDIASQQASMIAERLEALGFAVPGKDGGSNAASLQSYLPDPEQLFGHAQSTFSAATGVVVNTVIILFLAIFFAANPAGYRDGFLKLLPVDRRARIGQVLEETGHTLRWWLVGQLATMAIVAVSIGLMLLLMGIPNAVLLGLLAGALNFVPFLGPILAGIPVLLAAMPEGLAMLALVMGLFIIIESIEGYLINPLIQKRAVYLPPAWSLAALVAFGALFGGMGVALATPILAVARILVLRLYVEDVLERPRPSPSAAPDRARI